MSLQYGVPLEVYVNKFSHTRFEPMGYTKNPDIRIAKSMVDYIFRWLGITFLEGYPRGDERRETAGRKSSGGEGDDASGQSAPAAKKAGGLTATDGHEGRGSNGNGSNGSHANGSARKSAKAEAAKTEAAKADAKAEGRRTCCSEPASRRSSTSRC